MRPDDLPDGAAPRHPADGSGGPSAPGQAGPDEVDRSTWDRRLLRAGLADATAAAPGGGRFALEAAISGLHSVATAPATTDWPRVVQLYEALQREWRSPAVDVALLAAQVQQVLAGGGDPGQAEAGLHELAEEGPAYARRDAEFALADLCWRTGRHVEATERYRQLAAQAESEPVRRFCLRRAGGAVGGQSRMGPPLRP